MSWKLTRVVSFAYAKRFRILPIEVSKTRITIASAEPSADEWTAELHGLLRKEIVHVLCNPLAVERYLKDFYSVSQSLSGATAAAGEPVLHVNCLEHVLNVSANDAEPSGDDRHVVRLVDWLLQFAFEQRASDIHLEPRREQGNIRFRIDGVMHLVHHLQTIVLNAMTSGLKALARMDIVERWHPQDGRVKTKPPNGHRLNCAYQPCRQPSAKSCSCAFSTPRCWSVQLTNWGWLEQS